MSANFISKLARFLQLVFMSAHEIISKLARLLQPAFRLGLAKRYLSKAFARALKEIFATSLRLFCPSMAKAPFPSVGITKFLADYKFRLFKVLKNYLGNALPTLDFPFFFTGI